MFKGCVFVASLKILWHDLDLFFADIGFGNQ